MASWLTWTLGDAIQMTPNTQKTISGIGSAMLPLGCVGTDNIREAMFSLRGSSGIFKWAEMVDGDLLQSLQRLKNSQTFLGLRKHRLPMGNA